MEIAKLTSKGQLTLPINIRKKLNLQAGDQLAFFERDGEYIIVPTAQLQIRKQEKVADENTGKNIDVNIEGIVASLLFENLEVTEEMKAYAKKRLQGSVNYESERKSILEKYTNWGDK